MGLDTSHDCWNGAYSAFHRWRIKIAQVAGLPPLLLMEGFFKKGDSYDPFVEYALKYEGIASQYYDSLPIKWESLKPDPLHELLCHSDCDGDLKWEICAAMADRLQELIPLLPEEEAGGHIGVWKNKTQKFVDGLRLAYSKKENVEFY